MNHYLSGGAGYTGRRNLGGPALSVLFFPAAVLYHELLLRLFDRDVPFFELALLRIVLFSAAAGLALSLILDLLPWRRAARIAGGAVLGLGAVLFCVERGCRAMFGLYYGVGFMGVMAGDVVGGFGSTVGRVVINLIPFILLSFVPLAAYILLRASVIPQQGKDSPVRIIMAAALVACQLTAFLLSTLGPVKNYYTYEFTPNTAVPHFGLTTALRLELEYAVAGTPAPPLGEFLDDPVPTAEPTAQPSEQPSQAPREYGFNTLGFDFEKLAEAEPGDTDQSQNIKSIHQYLASLTPSQQNEYTGMFEGKNLILITAEGFSTAAIDQELTPTLYKLSREGFVFHNFYQPDWTQSTVGGEFAVMTGVIPNWFGKRTAMSMSVERTMSQTLGWKFREEGYSVPAWHDHTHDYYGRDRTHPNMGYDYAGVGGGLELPNNVWPNSDLEMMQATVDGYISDYVENGQPFHAYYMTVSGHGYYSWNGNAMSRKHRAEVEAKYPDLSETSQAYLACNMELDQALEYLVDKLEQAGIAGDTLIVMTGDHYPYLMVMEDGTDYYNELRGFEDKEGDTSRYKNTLLMWSGAIETPIQVDTPCYTPDIVPTLCNLFGLDYDSRLYSGRDIFAENYQADQYSNCMPLVVFANNVGRGNSWITAAGTYEASTNTFTPNPGVTVDDEYVSRVHRLVSAKVNYSKLMIQEDYFAHVPLPE